MNKPIIEVLNLSKSFGKSSAYALKNINFSIMPGDIFAIVGSSGAGKSTLMRCLVGLEKPSTGSIVVEGANLSLLSPEGLIPYRQRVGMVFQQFNLFPFRDVAGNICFPMEIHGVPKKQQDERVDELLDLVGLSHKKHAFPSTLSGGEKQRIGIARALANKPHILFCDEATSALDPTSTRSILALLQKLNDVLGLTIVVITHELDVVKQICNRVAVLSHGECVEIGNVIDVFADPQNTATKHLLHPLADQLPTAFLESIKPENKLVSLTFKGENTKQPIISRLIKGHNIEVNILLAGIDCFQKMVLGSLVIELTGSEDEMNKAIQFLENNDVRCEVLS